MRSIWLRFALTALMGVVAFLATLLIPSVARAATSAGPLCDLRGASVVVQVPDQTASDGTVLLATNEVPAGSNVAALCDTRGATMIAPAPQLQSEPTWLMLTPGSDALTALMEHSIHSAGPGQQQLAFDMELPDPGVIGVVPSVATATQIARIACPVVPDHEHDGVRASLERPPRA